MKMRFSLMEAVHYSGLLTESQRRDFVVKTYWQQIVTAYGVNHASQDITTAIEALPTEQFDVADQEQSDKARAGQIVDYISSFDPSPKKIYTLWMVQRFMKSEVSLDDLSGVQYYLQVFEANKNRITLKDIGQYKTIVQLADVIAKFEEKSAPAEKLMNNDDMQVVYDSGNVQVVIPKSKKGAIALGEGTVWCTAWPDSRGNRFANYAGGTLYVTIDKAKKERWQFYLPNEGTYSAEFMDRANRPIAIGTFFDTYPMVFKVIGEEKLLPWIDKIGLSLFSDAAVARVNPDTLPLLVRSVADMKRLNKESLMEPKVAQQIIINCDTNRKEMVDFYIRANVFDDDWWTTLYSGRVYDVFPLLPERFHTTERKEAFATVISSYQAIESHIPRPWSHFVEQEYWTSRVHHGASSLKINEIPEEYRNDDVVARVLRQNPSEMATYKPLTTEAAKTIISTTDYKNAKYLPPRLRNDEMFAYLTTKKPSTYSHDDFYRVMATFDIKLWAKQPEMAPHLLRVTATDYNFSNIPTPLRTPEALMGWVLGHPNKLFEIPANLITPAVLEKAAFQYVSYKEIIPKLKPEMVSPKLYVDTIAAMDRFSYLEESFALLPKYLADSPIVRAMYIDKNCLPVEKMGNLATPENVIARTKYESEELLDVPSSIMRVVAGPILEERPEQIVYMGDEILTEDVLFSFLKGCVWTGERSTRFMGADRQKAFDRFDKKLWSTRTVKLAIDLRLMEPDLNTVPEEFLSSGTVAAILRHNPDAYDDERSSVMGEEDITDALKKNWQVLNKIAPEKMTEGMAYTALAAHAWGNRIQSRLNSVSGYHEASQAHIAVQAALKRIPKSLWSKRCWKHGVGTVENLNKVPQRYLDDEMIVAALKADPRQINYVPNVTDWLATSGPAALGDKLKDKDFLAYLQQSGIFKLGRNWMDAKDMKREPLPSGGSYVLVKTQANFRAYLFDKKGRMVVELFSEKDAVKSHRSVDIESNAKLVHEFVQDTANTLAYSDWDILKSANIFKVGRYTLKHISELDRKKKGAGGKIMWASGEFSNGTTHAGFVRDNLVIEITESSSQGGWGRRSRTTIDKIENHISYHQLWPLSKEIAEAMNVMRLEGGWRHQSIGVDHTSSNEWASLFGEKLGENGEMSVWKGDGSKFPTIARKVSVFHNNLGYLGGATMLKDGTIKDPEVSPAQGHLTAVIVGLLRSVSTKK